MSAWNRDFEDSDEGIGFSLWLIVGFILAFFLFSLCVAEAQVTRSKYVTVGASLAPGLGFRPGFTAGLGGSISGQKYALTGEATFDTADKYQTNDGTGARIEMFAYRFVGERWALGGGGACSGYTTSLYSKGSCRPAPSVLFVPAKDLGLSGEYFFVGSDGLNRLQGPRFGVLATLTDNVRFDYRVGIYTFISNGRRVGVKNEFRIRYYF